MTVVFVHGVPETGAIWQGLHAELSDLQTLALNLPGFGSARPEGFGATKEEYAKWLADTLREIDGPVDVVGYDWAQESCCVQLRHSMRRYAAGWWTRPGPRRRQGVADAWRW